MILTGNIQNVREQIAELLTDATPDGWEATADTWIDVYTGLIQVGHAEQILPATLQTFAVDLVLTLWADETGDALNAAALYGLLSPIDGSLLRFFGDRQQCPITEYTVGPVGPRRPKDEGPSMFLACDITVRFQVSSTPSP